MKIPTISQSATAAAVLFLPLLLACSKTETTPKAAGMAVSASADATVSISNPGFESGEVNWGDAATYAISATAHTGSNSAKLSALGDRFSQTVTVTPNTSYTLKAWILGKGSIGAKSGSTVLGSGGGTYSTWTEQTVTFNSGSATSVSLYAAYNAGEGRFDDFSLATSGTTTPPAGATYPAQVLDLSKWKITLPTGPAEDPDEIFQPQLATFIQPTFFHLNATGDAVLFRANADGVTTSGSGYPRSELREMNSPATSDTYKASWSSGSGTHTMLIDQAVTHLPDVKKHIVIGQIHDANDDIIVFRLEGQKLFIDLSGTQGPVLTNSYVLGTRFTVKFVVANNQTACYYNGTKVYTYAKAFSGAYFKAGAYVQSSCQGEKKVTGESCSAYGEVAIYNVQVTHQ